MQNAAAIDAAIEWIEKWSRKNPEGPPASLDYELPRSNPDLCLSTIVEVLRLIPADTSNTHFQALAAGPLEDLLTNHGEMVVDAIETLLRRDPAFRLLFGGVWPSDIAKPVLARLAKYRTAW